MNRWTSFSFEELQALERGAGELTTTYPVAMKLWREIAEELDRRSDINGPIKDEASLAYFDRYIAGDR